MKLLVTQIQGLEPDHFHCAVLWCKLGRLTWNVSFVRQHVQEPRLLVDAVDDSLILWPEIA